MIFQVLKNLGRRPGRLLGLWLGAWGALLPEAALACPVCLGGQDDEPIRIAYYISTGLMVALLLGLAAFGFFTIRHYVKLAAKRAAMVDLAHPTNPQ